MVSLLKPNRKNSLTILLVHSMAKLKYEIKQISEIGHKVIDTSTNECMWDLANGSNVFTFEEAENMIEQLLAEEY